MWGCTQLDSMSGSSPSRDTEVIKAGGGGWRGGRSESMNTVDGRKEQYSLARNKDGLALCQGDSG